MNFLVLLYRQKNQKLSTKNISRVHQRFLWINPKVHLLIIHIHCSTRADLFSR